MTRTSDSNDDRPDRISQADLLTRAKAGDPRSYDRLLACATERVQLFVRLRLGAKLRQNLDSLDVVQDAYLAAHEKLDEFEWRGDRAFVNWLCGIADNRIRQLREHHGAQKRAPAGSAKALSRVVDELAESGHGVLTSAARREWRHRLEASFDELEDEVREALALRYFGGMSAPAIAERMERSESAVRRLVGAGLRRLGGTLRGFGEQR